MKKHLSLFESNEGPWYPMFTGLIETLGTVDSLMKRAQAVTLGIKPEMDGFSVGPGGSVAINGACLTHEKTLDGVLFFTAVHETVERTTLGLLRQGARVNLERALPANGRLDGHLVLGHVDGIGTILSDSMEGVSVRRKIRLPESCVRFCAEKGSVAIDGISLTIAGTAGDTITVALIPATLAATTMLLKRAGDTVNIECDVIARYCDRLIAVPAHQPGGSLATAMERAGF